MNAAFKRLGMPDNRVSMRLIAGLDYYGNVVGAGEIKPDSSTAG
jgi:hypothetical protein